MRNNWKGGCRDFGFSLEEIKNRYSVSEIQMTKIKKLTNSEMNWKGEFEGETDANRQERVLKFGKPFHTSNIEDQNDATKRIHSQPWKLIEQFPCSTEPPISMGKSNICKLWLWSQRYLKDAAVGNGNTIPNSHPWPSNKSVFTSNEIAQLMWTDHWDAAALWNLSCLMIGKKYI